MSNGCGFLEVIRVLETVGPQTAQIRAVGPRKWSDWSNLSIISVILGLQTTHFRFIYARMCIFASKCVQFHPNVYIYDQFNQI